MANCCFIWKYAQKCWSSGEYPLRSSHDQRFRSLWTPDLWPTTCKDQNARNICGIMQIYDDWGVASQMPKMNRGWQYVLIEPTSHYWPTAVIVLVNVICYLHTLSPTLEWHPFPNCMSHLQDLAMVLLQFGEGATSGVAVFLRVEEGSWHQLLRSLTPTWRRGRSTTQQEYHPLDCIVEPAPHCWIHCTGLVDMMAALVTIPFTD